MDTFVHQVVPGADVTLLLLHGTGGDEHDLLPLGDLLWRGAARLSPRGQVLEHGRARFFRRHAEGVLDLDDLAERTAGLSRWVTAAVAHHALPARVVAVGFSNGANIAASMLLRGTGALHAAVLLSPMLPFEPTPLPSLVGRRVFIGAGQADPLVPAAQSERLGEVLRASGADVTLHWTPGGHGITPDEVAAARRWMDALR